MLLAVFLLSISLLTGGVRSFEDDGPTMRIPMHRKGKSTGNSLKNYLHKKFNKIDFEKLEGANEIDVIVKNNVNMEYYGEVTLGTPPQKFTMSFETGTRQTWIPSQYCDVCEHRKYNSSASTTYVANGAKVNFPGDVKGYLSRDTFCVGEACVTGQDFVEITKMTPNGAVTDGVIGLPPSDKTSLGVNSFFYNLLKQKKISNPVFAFWFNRKMNESGELVLGGVDKTRFEEPIAWVNLTRKNDWTINMEGVMINSTVLACKGKCKTEFDTGSPMIISGMVETDAIHKILNFTYQPTPFGKLYYVANCTEEMLASYPDMSFVIEGKKYVLTSKDYLELVPGLIEPSVTYCMSYIFGLAVYDFNDWIIGIPFMGKYYTVFDYGQKRVGLAETKKEQKKAVFKKPKNLLKEFFKKLIERMEQDKANPPFIIKKVTYFQKQ